MNFTKYKLPEIPRYPIKPDYDIVSYPDDARAENEAAIERYNDEVYAYAAYKDGIHDRFKKDALTELGIDYSKGIALFDFCWDEWSRYYDEDGCLLADNDCKLVWEKLQVLAEILLQP